MDIPEAAAAIKARWIAYARNVDKPRSCIHCAGKRIWWDGRPERTASVWCGDGVVYLTGIVCRRVKCGVCRASWRVRPPGLCAHKHYQRCVVARAASRHLFEPRSTQTRVAAEHGCSRRTVGRWIRWVAALAEPAMVMKKVLLAVDAPVVPRLRNVAQCARKASRGIGQTVLERAAEVLGLLEDLGSALRLEPPGLRAVLERVVGNRAGVATYARPLIPELARSPPG